VAQPTRMPTVVDDGDGMGAGGKTARERLERRLGKGGKWTGSAVQQRVEDAAYRDRVS